MSIKVLEDNCTLKDLVEYFQDSVSDLLPEELKQVGNSDTPEGILARIERCEASLKELENRPMDELVKAEMTRVNKPIDTGGTGASFWATPWPYLIGGALLAGAAVGGYFLFRPPSQVAVGAAQIEPR